MHLVFGNTGSDLTDFPTLVAPWEKATGNKVNIVPMPSSTTDQFAQYRLWLAAGNSDIDVYQTDVIWAPQLANHFVDLTAAAKDVAAQNFPSIIESQTVDGKLVALPIFTDAPALYYRKDLLEKYNLPVPKTWHGDGRDAKTIMDGERAAGNKDMWGFVFQGNAYEGLTCDALEWVKSYGGGQIVEPDGKITINNPKAAAALNEAKAGSAPSRPKAFWPTRKKNPVASGSRAMPPSCATGPMPMRLATAPTARSRASSACRRCRSALLATSRPRRWAAGTLPCRSTPSTRRRRSRWRSTWPDRKRRSGARLTNRTCRRSPRSMTMPTSPRRSRSSPSGRTWSLNAVPRPSAPTQSHYNEVSSKFWTAVHNTLSGNGSAADNLAMLEADLTDIKGSNNWQ